MVGKGVAFEPPVLAYLDQISEKEDRSRSWYINRLIKEHAQSQGVDLSTFALQTAYPNAKE